jgi:hypothetical protein
LLAAIVTLAAIDPFVPDVLHRLETARYESDSVFRFENSDLFPLGPLVQYLREHPTRDRPRIVFFGNSVVWGYFLDPQDSLPAQFQRLTSKARVFNMAINGFETGNAYIITKHIIDAVDGIYLFPAGGTAHPMLPKLVDVEPVDLERFALTPVDPQEARLASLLGFWRLRRDAYRLQTALFGTSTRQYVYMNKMSIPRKIWRARRVGAVEPVPERASRNPVPRVEVETEPVRAPVSEARRRQLAAAYSLLWDYAELVRAHSKQAVVVNVKGSSFDLAPSDRADLNRIFRPHVSFVTLTIPAALRFDRLHLSAEGARAVAHALLGHAPPLIPGR